MFAGKAAASAAMQVNISATTPEALAPKNAPMGEFRMSGIPAYLDFLRGTLAPFLRASERPIAMACLRLLTLPPLPLLPDLSVPCLRLRMALATLLLAPFPYFRWPDLAAILILL
jgi:hypothetical protein